MSEVDNKDAQAARAQRPVVKPRISTFRNRPVSSTPVTSVTKSLNKSTAPSCETPLSLNKSKIPQLVTSLHHNNITSKPISVKTIGKKKNEFLVGKEIGTDIQNVVKNVKHNEKGGTVQGSVGKVNEVPSNKKESVKKDMPTKGASGLLTGKGFNNKELTTKYPPNKRFLVSTGAATHHNNNVQPATKKLTCKALVGKEVKDSVKRTNNIEAIKQANQKKLITGISKTTYRKELVTKDIPKKGYDKNETLRKPPIKKERATLGEQSEKISLNVEEKNIEIKCVPTIAINKENDGQEINETQFKALNKTEYNKNSILNKPFMIKRCDKMTQWQRTKVLQKVQRRSHRIRKSRIKSRIEVKFLNSCHTNVQMIKSCCLPQYLCKIQDLFRTEKLMGRSIKKTIYEKSLQRFSKRKFLENRRLALQRETRTAKDIKWPINDSLVTIFSESFLKENEDVLIKALNRTDSVQEELITNSLRIEKNLSNIDLKKQIIGTENISKDITINEKIEWNINDSPDPNEGVLLHTLDKEESLQDDMISNSFQIEENLFNKELREEIAGIEDVTKENISMEKMTVEASNEVVDNYLINSTEEMVIDQIKTDEMNKEETMKTANVIHEEGVIDKGEFHKLKLHLSELTAEISDLKLTIEEEKKEKLYKKESKIIQSNCQEHMQNENSNLFVEEAKETLNKMRTELLKTTTETVRKKDVHISSLNKRLRLKTGEFEILKKSQNTLTEEYEKVQTENAILIEQLHNQKGIIDKLEKKLNELTTSYEIAEKRKRSKTTKQEEALAETKRELKKLTAQREVENNKRLKEQEANLQLQQAITAIKEIGAKQAMKLNEFQKREEKMHIWAKDLKNIQMYISSLEKRLHDSKSNIDKENAELKTLRKSNKEKNEELKKIRKEMDTQKLIITDMLEQRDIDKHFLEIRNQMIRALEQTNRKQTKKIEELLFQIDRKNNHISELNNELIIRSEDYRELNDLLADKQMEVKRQKHLMQLQGERNKREQELRAKQERNITEMKMKIKQLKEACASSDKKQKDDEQHVATRQGSDYERLASELNRLRRKRADGRPNSN